MHLTFGFGSAFERGGSWDQPFFTSHSGLRDHPINIFQLLLCFRCETFFLYGILESSEAVFNPMVVKLGQGVFDILFYISCIGGAENSEGRGDQGTYFGVQQGAV